MTLLLIVIQITNSKGVWDFYNERSEKVGRPRTFDEKTALEAAMNAFWAKVPDGASMKNLTSAMGISGPSFYSTFGDKRELYLKTIDFYADVDGCAPIVACEAEPDIAKAIKDFLTTVVTRSTQAEGGPKGCFLAFCVATTVGEVEGVSERMEQAIRDTDERLAGKYRKAIENGDLPAAFPAHERGCLLHDMRQGLVHRSRAGWSADALLADVDDRVAMILALSNTLDFRKVTIERRRKDKSLTLSTVTQRRREIHSFAPSEHWLHCPSIIGTHHSEHQVSAHYVE